MKNISLKYLPVYIYLSISFFMLIDAWDKDSVDSIIAEICAETNKFVDGCNKCECNGNGISARCTKGWCDAQKHSICTEKSRFTIDDKTCVCDENIPPLCFEPKSSVIVKRQTSDESIFGHLNGICKLPIVPGPCRASLPRYGFENGRCVMFVYGGCLGNENNFETKEECEKTCDGHSSKGTPKGRTLITGNSTNHFSNHPQPRRMNVIGNANNNMQEKSKSSLMGRPPIRRNIIIIKAVKNFIVLEDPQQQYLQPKRISHELTGRNSPSCKLPLDKGPCRAVIRRWGYKEKLNSCVMFTYGGCLGNKNNFKNQFDCELACLEFSKPKYTSQEITGRSRPICMLPLEEGPCRALFRRWGYSWRMGACVMFIYGGCLGNKNNFNSKYDCEMTCMDLRQAYIQPRSISHEMPERNKAFCELPLDVGFCRAYFRRWGYSSKMGTCVMFIWGGCGGNKNNFKSKQDCEMACMGIT